MTSPNVQRLSFPALLPLVIGLAAGLSGCPRGNNNTTPAQPQAGSADPSPDPDEPPPEGAASPENPPDSPTPSGCLSNDDCDDGICEGLGCTDDQPGTCVPAARACTRDLRPYCGCDGETFTSSGSCPGRRYAAKGPCESESVETGTKADGASCLSASECSGGLCEGQGCTDDKPGKCASKTRMCTQDVAEYCGCDGVTFTSSGSCPNKRFAKRGAC